MRTLDEVGKDTADDEPSAGAPTNFTPCNLADSETPMGKLRVEMAVVLRMKTD